MGVLFPLNLKTNVFGKRDMARFARKMPRLSFISYLLLSFALYSSQKTFLLFLTHPSRLLDLSFQSPHLRLWRPSQQLLRDFQRENS